MAIVVCHHLRVHAPKLDPKPNFLIGQLSGISVVSRDLLLGIYVQGETEEFHNLEG